MRLSTLFLLNFTLIIGFNACKTSRVAVKTIELSTKNKLVLADSLSATNYSVNDVHDNFFAKITDTDISIQLKKNFAPEVSHRDKLEEYYVYLQHDVRNFTKKEAEFMEKCVRAAYKMCNQVSNDIFPKELKIIKMQSKPYGDGTYYTREDCIMVPASELKTFDEAKVTEVLLHELFHIYSRFHENERLELYDLVGFHLLENTTLVVPQRLASRILLNPDGVNISYAIDIQLSPDESVKAVPIIYSTFDGFQPDKKEFFNHLKFELFKIQQTGRSYEVVCNRDGSSTLDMTKIPDFYRQIKDNTDYIIHPDEILADNFMYMVLQANGKEPQNDGKPKKFSAEGKRLLENIKKVGFSTKK